MTDDVASDDVTAAHEALLEFLYLCPVGIIEFDRGGAIGMMNPLCVQLLMPLVGAGGFENVFDIFHDLAPELRNLVEGFKDERGTICENFRAYIGPVRGKQAPLVLSITLIQISPARIMGVVNDISKLVAQERQIRQDEAWLTAIMAGAEEYAFYTLDRNGRIDSWNASGERLHGFTAEEVLGKPLSFLHAEWDDRIGCADDHVDFSRQNGWHVEEMPHRRKDGETVWCSTLVSVLENDGTIEGPVYSVVTRDVSERRRAGRELRRPTTHDHLTGAFNRRHFFDMAEVEQQRWQRFGRPVALIAIDGDHFKKVNDRYGHAAGDEVLKAITRTCERGLRPRDMVARLGGEEFVVLLPGTELEGACVVAERIRAAIEEMVVKTDGHEIRFTISAGVAAMAQRTETIADLLKRADAALYRAKEQGRNRFVVADGDVRVAETV